MSSCCNTLPPRSVCNPCTTGHRPGGISHFVWVSCAVEFADVTNLAEWRQYVAAGQIVVTGELNAVKLYGQPVYQTTSACCPPKLTGMVRTIEFEDYNADNQQFADFEFYNTLLVQYNRFRFGWLTCDGLLFGLERCFGFEVDYIIPSGCGSLSYWKGKVSWCGLAHPRPILIPGLLHVLQEGCHQPEPPPRCRENYNCGNALSFRNPLPLNQPDRVNPAIPPNIVEIPHPTGPNQGIYDMNNSDFSFEFWIRSDDYNTTGAIISKKYRLLTERASSWGWLVGFGFNTMAFDVAEWRQDNVKHFNYRVVKPITGCGWIHVVVIKRENITDWEIYLNGDNSNLSFFVIEDEGTPNEQNLPLSNPNEYDNEFPIHFGIDTFVINDSPDLLTADLKEIRFYRRALTQEEILANFRNPQGYCAEPFNPAGIVGRWPLNETGGQTAPDTSGQANNGSLSNLAFPLSQSYQQPSTFGTNPGDWIPA